MGKNKKSSSYEYEQGRKAAKRGIIPSGNPYPKDTKKYEDWLNGLLDGSL